MKRRVLVFGGTGSLGRKLIERYLVSASDEIAVYSRDEAKHWSLRNELSSGPLAPVIPRLRFFVGDVRDANRVQNVIRTYDPTTIIIAAALKQVDTCELSPSESVLTNLVGTQNVIDAVTCERGNVSEVLFVSTDKACSPVNVYGMCKAVSERIVTSQSQVGRDRVKWLCTRYGNVLESRGSIIPLFKHQALYAPSLTVTDRNMTRFVMTLDESVDLIQHALECGKSGDTWVPRLPAMKIGHLADIFAQRCDKPVRIVGARPGEKQHEDLINESESVRTRPTSDNRHFVISPATSPGTGDPFVYSSKQDVWQRDQLEGYLQGLGILDAPLDAFKGRSIEEIVK